MQPDQRSARAPSALSAAPNNEPIFVAPSEEDEQAAAVGQPRAEGSDSQTTHTSTMGPPAVSETNTTSNSGHAIDEAAAQDTAVKPPTSAAPAPSAPASPPNPFAKPAIPEIITFHKNADEDDVGYKAMLEGATNPQIVEWVHNALRTVLFVTFPMFTIAFHPNTRYKLGFPHMVIASVSSTALHRYTVGEQIGLHSWTWRGMAYGLVTGTVFNYWRLENHIGAWYGMIALFIFIGSLVGHGILRRFMYLYFFIYIMEMRTLKMYFGTFPPDSTARWVADLVMGTLFGLAADLIPRPLLCANKIDGIIAALFAGLGKMLTAMQHFTAAPDPYAAWLFFNDQSGFAKLEQGLAVMPALLWFTNWEPLEFPLRNPIRRLKLTLLRRILALTYAAFSAGRTIARLRRAQADQLGMNRMRSHIAHRIQKRYRKACKDKAGVQEKKEKSVVEGNNNNNNNNKETEAAIITTTTTTKKMSSKFHDAMEDDLLAHPTAAFHSSSESDDEAARMEEESFVYRARDELSEELYKEIQEQRRELRENMQKHVGVFSVGLATALTKLGKTRSTPEALLKEVAFAALAQQDIDMRRNIRLERFEMEHHLAVIIKERLRRRHADDPDFAAVVGDWIEDDEALMEALQIITDNEVYLRFYTIYFYMMLSMVAGEIHSFGKLMQDYKPEKPLGRRLFEYFIAEPWHDFWSELYNRLSLARPFDVRTVKDAIKMTCAYLAACAFNLELWTDTNGLYFFGTTLLLGLPVEEESLSLGVSRMAGNAFGSALGYLSVHNTRNLSQLMGLMFFFVFMCQCFKNHPTCGHMFFYASLMTIAGVMTSLNSSPQLLTRVLSGTYTIIMYFLCCLLVFPTNCVKVLWGYRVKLSKVLSEIIDDVALTVHLPVGTGGCTYVQGAPDAMETLVVYHPSPEAEQMCTQLNIEVDLVKRLMTMCTKWTPFAARDAIVRGKAPFPAADSGVVHGVQVRMTAIVQVLVFGAQLLHRPRSSPILPHVQRLLTGSFSLFLRDFADASRLLFQDYIDSLHKCRTWSFPAALNHTAYMMRLKARLHAVMYEAFIMLGARTSMRLAGITKEDLNALRQELTQYSFDTAHGAGQPQGTTIAAAAAANMNTATPAAGGGTRGGATDHGNGMLEETASEFAAAAAAAVTGGEGGMNNDNNNNNHSSSTATTAIHRDEDEVMNNGNVLLPPQARSQGSPGASAAAAAEAAMMMRMNNLSSSFAQDPNASFAGRFLQARREALERGDVNLDRIPRRSDTAMELQPALTNRSFARQDPSRVYQHTAQLDEAHMEPQDAYPVHASAERDLAAQLERRTAAERQASEAAAAAAAAQGMTGGGHHNNNYNNNTTAVESENTLNDGMAAGRRICPPDPSAGEQFSAVVPTDRRSRNVSHLVLVPERGEETQLPRYTGPKFSYREDEVDLPMDTDHLAIVAILLSCNSIIEEFEAMVAAVNHISGFQKQLHEESLLLPYITKWSDKVVALRKRVYERYHYPAPPPQRHAPINSQMNPFEKWEF